MKRHHYNIYLNSPQLAVNENRKKYYLEVIANNNKIANTQYKKYPYTYFFTSYNKILYPNKIIAEM